ncbi:MAG: hypothetical protein QW776_05115 [Candidatus Nitrosocaldus sp.]
MTINWANIAVVKIEEENDRMIMYKMVTNAGAVLTVYISKEDMTSLVYKEKNL